MRKAGWIAVMLIFMISASAMGEEEWYIRVVSRDASEAAQAEKMAVRDAVLMMLPDETEKLEKMLPDIEKALGPADCRADIRLWAPDGGEERPTLYITIGGGQGPNWWGILYGPEKMMEADGDETDEIRIIWPVIDWILRMLGW